MPRKGMGQKIQTATGQQYGQAKVQKEAQRTQPMLQEQNLSAKPVPQQWTRPTERPTANSNSPAAIADTTVGLTDGERMTIMSVLPMLSKLSSMPDSSRHMRAFYRSLVAKVGRIEEDFQSKGYR